MTAYVQPIGKMVYELANGTIQEYPFGLVQIEFMGELTAGRVIFDPDDAAPLLGVTTLESVGIMIDPTNRTLKHLPAISPKLRAVSDLFQSTDAGSKEIFTAFQSNEAAE